MISMMFMISIYKVQTDSGRIFLHEHPAFATSWRTPEVLHLLGKPAVQRVVAHPCQLGQHTEMKTGLKLHSNQLCSDVPTEVQALSSGLDTNYKVTTGNSIGTVCGWIEDSRFPGAGDTSITGIDYSGQGLTGTIPTGDDVWKV